MKIYLIFSLNQKISLKLFSKGKIIFIKKNSIFFDYKHKILILNTYLNTQTHEPNSSCAAV